MSRAVHPRNPNTTGLTFQEPHRTIEALGAQLVVAERAEELADENVDLFRDIKGAHIAEQQLNLVVAPLRTLSLLQTKTIVHIGQ